MLRGLLLVFAVALAIASSIAIEKILDAPPVAGALLVGVLATGFYELLRRLTASDQIDDR